MGFSLGGLWEGLDFWDEEENKKQRVARTQRTQRQAQPAQTKKKDTRSNLAKAWSQVNLWDDGKSIVQNEGRLERNQRLETERRALEEQLAQQRRSGLINNQQFAQEFAAINEAYSPKLTQHEKDLAATADSVANNDILRPALVGLSTLKDSSVGAVGGITAQAGRGVNAIAGRETGVGNVLRDAGDTVQNWGQVDPNGKFVSQGLGDNLITGGITLGGDVLNQFNPLARAGTLSKYFTSSANDLAGNMEQAGYTPRQSFAGGAALGATNAALEKLSLGAISKTGIGGAVVPKITSNLVSRIPKSITNNALSKVTTRLVSGAVTEGATEYAQQVAENTAARHTYDPTRSYTEGAKEAALTGAILGAGASGSVDIVQRYSKPGQVEQDATTAKQKSPNLSNVTAKNDPTWRKLDNKITEALQRASESTGKLKKEYLREAKDYLRQRNLRRDELTQGGFIRLPGKATELAVTHNLSADNLAHAQELGGIPQPSLGIVNPQTTAIDGFGDITLVGNNSLADPKIKGNRVFGADVYSPRQPRGNLRSNSGTAKMLTERFAPAMSKYTDSNYLNLESSDSINESLANETAVMAQFLEDNKIKPKQAKLEINENTLREQRRKAGLSTSEQAQFIVDNIDKLGKLSDIDKSIAFLESKGIKPEPAISRADDRYTFRDQIRKAKLEDKFNQYVKDVAKEAGATSKIFAGYTPSGTPRYLDETIDNVLKTMRKEKTRAGEGGFFGSGDGATNAKLTKQYRSLDQIVNDKDRLVTSEKMEQVKESISKQRETIQQKLEPLAKHQSDNQFTEYDNQMEAINDYLAGDKTWFNEKFPNAPESIIKKLDKLREDIKNTPTEYFESVPDRAVQLNEFEEALVPEGTDKQTLKILQDNGIAISFYKGSEGDSSSNRQQRLIELVDRDNQRRFPVDNFEIAKASGQGGYLDLSKDGGGKAMSVENLPETLKQDYERINQSNLVAEALAKYPGKQNATGAEGKRIVANRQKYIDGEVQKFNQKYGTDFKDIFDLKTREDFVRDNQRTEISDLRTNILYGKGKADRFYSDSKYAQELMGGKAMSVDPQTPQGKPTLQDSLGGKSTKVSQSEQQTTSKQQPKHQLSKQQPQNPSRQVQQSKNTNQQKTKLLKASDTSELTVSSDGRIANIDQYIKEQVNTQETKSPKTGRVKKLKRQWIDSLAPAEDNFRQAVKDGKLSQETLDDIIVKNGKSLRAGTMANINLIESGIVDLLHKMPKQDYDNLGQVLIARQSQDLRANGVETGRSAKVDQEILNKYGKKYENEVKQFRKAADFTLDKAVEHNLVSKETAQMLRKKYPNYVPMNRVIEEIENKGSFNSSQIASIGKQTVVQKIKGSKRAVQNPMESMIAKVQDMSRQGMRNDAAISWVDALKTTGDAKLLEGDIPKGQSTISVIRNGNKEIYAVDSDMEAAAKGLTKEQLNIAFEVGRKITRVFKTGTTGINLPFTLTNLVRDQQTAFLNMSKGEKEVFSAIPKTIFETVGHGDLYQEAVKQGAISTSFDLTKPDLKLTAKNIRKRGSNLGVLSKIEDVVGRTEEYTRLQQYKATKEYWTKQGLSEEQATTKATLAAQQNSADFARAGDFGRVLNAVLPYTNAGVQGTRAYIRGAAKNPARYGLKATVTLGMPMVAVALWNYGDDEREEIYNDISEFDKQANFIIVTPWAKKNEEGKWEGIVKVPKPPGISALMYPAEQAIGAMKGNDPLAFSDITQAVLGFGSPLGDNPKAWASTITPQFLKPAIETTFNTNLFTGRDIVPYWLQNKPANEQVYEGTSGTARMLGGVSNTSPLNVEHLIKGYGGEVGLQGLNAVDNLLNKAGVIPEEQIGGRSIPYGFSRRFTEAYDRPDSTVDKGSNTSSVTSTKEKGDYISIGTTEKNDKGDYISRDKYDAVIHAFSGGSFDSNVAKYDDNQLRQAISDIKGEMKAEFNKAGLDMANINFDSRLAQDYAKYKKKLDGSNQIETDKAKEKFLRTAYNSQLDEIERDLYTLSEDDLLSYYERGVLTDQNLENALTVEKQLYDAGLISKETLARKLGISARGYKTSKSGGRRGGSRGGRSGSKTKKSKYGYSILGFGGANNQSAITKSLVELFKNATI